MAKRNIPHNTETFEYVNVNPKDKTTGDCVLRAIAGATGKDWDEVLDDLVSLAHKYKLMPNDTKLYGRYLDSLGYIKEKQPRKADGRKYTGSEFCRYLDSHEAGVDVLAHIGGHHIVHIACIDGRYKVVDTWNSTEYTIGNYWIRRF